MTSRLEGLLGGAFYDLASQCLTPLIALGGVKGPTTNVIVNARRLGVPSCPPVRLTFVNVVNIHNSRRD